MRAFLFAAPCFLLAGLSYAQPVEFDKAQSPPPHSDNKPTHTKAIDKIGKPVQPAAPSLPANINITVGGKLELSSDMKEANTPGKEEKWFSEFFNVKATDVVIAAFTVIIGVFTCYLYRATERLARISGQQEESTRIIERAYVRLSHLDTGIIIRVLGMAEGNFRVKNFGHTPARITSIILNPKLTPGKSLPKIPDYSGMEEKVMRAFLVRDDELFFYRHFPLGAINDDLERGVQTVLSQRA